MTMVRRLDEKQHAKFCEVVILAHCFFQDEKKVSAWIRFKNLNFGGVSPETMIERGFGEKLIKWMKTQLDENKPLVSKKEEVKVEKIS